MNCPIWYVPAKKTRSDLACLYLRPSTVEHDASAVAVTLSSGETLHVKQTKYQGFNSPQAVVSGLHEDQRDVIYATAATVLANLVQRQIPNTSRTLTGPRHELTVQLKLHRQQLTRTYFHHYGRITEHRSTWQWPGNQPMGQALFAALFGTQAQCDKVLQVLFESELARPIRYPVRIRIQTDTPTLAALPWASMTWEGNSLRDNGWTFELMSTIPLTATPDFPTITLKAPCPVLMIAPSTAPHVEVHHSALEERLSHAWPFYHEKPQWVRDWAGIEQAWQRRRPRIVYYYGPAESADNVLTVTFYIKWRGFLHIMWVLGHFW